MKRIFFALLCSLLLTASPIFAAITVGPGDQWREAQVDSITLGDGAGATLTITFDNTGTDVILTVTTAAFNVSAGVIQQAGTPVVLESRTITGGVGIASMGDLSANRTVTFDATQLDALTWDAGSLANFSWTYSLSGASDPVINYADAVVNLTTGAWQQGGTPVVIETRSLTGGNGIAAIGDFSTNRTITVQLLDAADGTGSAGNNSGLEFADTGSDEVALLQGCADSEILKWVNGTNTWDCSADVGANPFTVATPIEATIATGVLDASACAADNFCMVDCATEGGAGTDDVTTINCTAGALLLLRADVTTNTCVLQAQTASDFSLDAIEDYSLLHCDATNSVEMISRHNGG